MKSIRNILQTLNIFRFLKTTHKLFLVTIITLVGIGAIGSVYFSLQETTRRVAEQHEGLTKLAEVNERIRLDIADSHSALKDFFINKDLSYLEKFNTIVSKTTSGLEELNSLSKSNHHKDIIRNLNESISDYKNSVKEASDSIILLGLDPNSGLQGEMRAEIHQTEDLINAYDVPHLKASMLMMRRHEKDFLQRKTKKYIDSMAKEQTHFGELLKASNLTEEAATQVRQFVAAYHDAFLLLAETVKESQALIRRVDEKVALLTPIKNALNEETARLGSILRDQGSEDVNRLNRTFLIVLAAMSLFMILSLTFFALGIVRERARELARAEELAKAQEENDLLNDSVATLMEAAAQLSERDLTVQVPVTEDITGNIADALNMMTSETAQVMININSVAGQLETAAGTVREQGDRVASVAATEREVVSQALDKLQESTNTIAEITELVLNCDQLAENSDTSTKRALLAVRDTMRNMNEIRNSVSETEKGIKRLGERSQEVGGILEIIKDIAGRTHTLALNAGMQAVAAGEAGRGFSVVADEVQRLAETARESTDQIASLVQSIQSEATETMARMNKTIEQVVEGSSLAENAGKRMRLTRRSTDELVTAVSQISERSKNQMAINEDLRTQASKLQESTTATEQELKEQNTQTEEMFNYVNSLVDSVRVFKLPESS